MDTRPFSPDVILTSIPALLPYLEVTLMVGLISVVTGSAFGLLLAWARLSGNRILSSLAEGYTYIIRCTPSIVLLFIVFYGLPVFARDALGIDLDNLSRAISSSSRSRFSSEASYRKCSAPLTSLSPRGSMRRRLPSVFLLGKHS